MTSKKKPSNPLKYWAIFSGIAFQMGATIFLCSWVGKKLDARYIDPENTQWFTIGFVLFGVAISLYAVLRQLKRFDN